MNTPTTQVKFRPSLTLDEINTILEHLPSQPHHTALRKKLELFTLKATHGIVSPSHVATQPSSMIDSLGFGNRTDSNQTAQGLYDAWIKNPQILSSSQLNQVQSYRYMNDLMSPEEEQSYESQLIKGAV